MRAMAVRPDGEAQVLIDVKAVDDAYPLYGEVGAGRRQDFRAGFDEPNTAVVDQALLDRLGHRNRRRDQAGRKRTLRITGVIAREPDRLSGGAAFGPRVLTTTETLEGTGPARARHADPLALSRGFPEGAGEARIAAFRDAVTPNWITAAFACATAATRRRRSPALSRSFPASSRSSDWRRC